MLHDQNIYSERIYLKNLNPNNISAGYIDWMNDYEITKYLEVRFNSPITENAISQFIAENNSSQENYLFGIFLIENDQHIGNIRISNIDYNHYRADLGYIIGEKKIWGKGFGTEAIELSTQFCKSFLGLKKIMAGCYDINTASQRVLVKAGFEKEAIFRNHVEFEGQRISSIIYTKEVSMGS